MEKDKKTSESTKASEVDDFGTQFENSAHTASKEEWAESVKKAKKKAKEDKV